jgi:hypothetical protein
MFLLIVIIIVIVALFATLWPSDGGDDQVRELKLKFKKYSGVNPDLYISYINNLDLMAQHIDDGDTAAMYLYKAIENIEDLALYIPAYELSNDITSVVLKGEQMILYANKTFRPK